MRRKRDDPKLGQAILYSAILHLAIFGVGFVSVFIPKENNVLLTDVQIMGEGELQDILDNQERDIAEEKPIEPKEEEIKPAEEPKEDLPKPAEEEQPKQEPEPQPEPTPPPPEEPAKEELAKEEAVKEEIKEEIREEPKEDVKEEPIPKEEPAPKPKEEPKEEKPKPEVKKPKKKNRKALMDAIKTAEKKKTKEKNRKKMLELAEKASKKKKDDAFDKMLNESANALKKTAGQGSKGRGAGAFGLGSGLTDSDYEMISSQIYPHWAVPSGVRDAENIIIEIQVQLRENGEVIPSSVKILDEKRYATDYIFRAAADSARRAVLEASPLKIPREKIDIFKDFTLRFNLKEALGG
ncbi:MAG: hypothetical protein LBL99_01740 [Holosporaceae bacterium]|jgi:hypothetical protein|nr:hypothetical protein [Holosporaceae bacterium]